MTSNETRPVVSDEALLDAYKAATDRYYNDNLLQPVDLMRDDIADEMRMAGLSAVREALTAAPVPQVVIPEIPDGWFLANLEYRDQWGDYLAELWDESVLPLGDSFVEARNVDPWKALQAAIDAVKAEVAS